MSKQVCSSPTCQSDLSMQHSCVAGATVGDQCGIYRKSSEAPGVLEANVQGGLDGIRRRRSHIQVGRVGVLKNLLRKVRVTTEEEATIVRHVHPLVSIAGD